MTCDIGNSIAVCLTTTLHQLLNQDQVLAYTGHRPRELHIEAKARLAWILGRQRNGRFAGIIDVIDPLEDIPNLSEFESRPLTGSGFTRLPDGRSYFVESLPEIRMVLTPYSFRPIIRLGNHDSPDETLIYDTLSQNAFIVSEGKDGVRTALVAVADILMMELEPNAATLREWISGEDATTFDFDPD